MKMLMEVSRPYATSGLLIRLVYVDANATPRTVFLVVSARLVYTALWGLPLLDRILLALRWGLLALSKPTHPVALATELHINTDDLNRQLQKAGAKLLTNRHNIPALTEGGRRKYYAVGYIPAARKGSDE